MPRFYWRFIRSQAERGIALSYQDGLESRHGRTCFLKLEDCAAKGSSWVARCETRNTNGFLELPVDLTHQIADCGILASVHVRIYSSMVVLRAAPLTARTLRQPTVCLHRYRNLWISILYREQSRKFV
jgi:hypothetical protein